MTDRRWTFAEGHKPQSSNSYYGAHVRESVAEQLRIIGEANNWSKALVVKVLLDEALEMRRLYEKETGHPVKGVLTLEEMGIW